MGGRGEYGDKERGLIGIFIGEIPKLDKLSV